MSAVNERVDLPIEGMTCASCANRIERKLNRLDGVYATVNYATERAAVDYDPEVAQLEDLLGAVQAAGYQTVLATAEPADIPDRWRYFAFRSYLALQRVDTALLEPYLPPQIFYNLVFSARKPAR